MSDPEMVPIEDVQRSFDYLARRLGEVRGQRDRYREWFEKLNASVVDYIQTVEADRSNASAALAELRAKYEHVTQARTRANVKRGEETRRAVLEAWDDGKSIAATARDLGISPSRVATIRTEENRKPEP